MPENEKILIIESFGIMVQYDSVERVRGVVEKTLEKMGDEVEFNYRRFQWMAARMTWSAIIVKFEYVDNVLLKLRRGMNKYFDMWGIKISIDYQERE